MKAIIAFLCMCITASAQTNISKTVVLSSPAPPSPPPPAMFVGHAFVGNTNWTATNRFVPVPVLVSPQIDVTKVFLVNRACFDNWPYLLDTNGSMFAYMINLRVPAGVPGGDSGSWMMVASSTPSNPPPGDLGTYYVRGAWVGIMPNKSVFFSCYTFGTNCFLDNPWTNAPVQSSNVVTTNIVTGGTNTVIFTQTNQVIAFTSNGVYEINEWMGSFWQPLLFVTNTTGTTNWYAPDTNTYNAIYDLSLSQ